MGNLKFHDTNSVKPLVTRGEVATYHKGRIHGIIGLDFKTGLLWRTGEQALRNKETYYLLINTWLYLALDLEQSSLANYFKQYILREGLLAAIKLSTTTADELRRKGVNGCYVARSLWTYRNTYVDDESQSLSRASEINTLRDMLQFFDYPRRLSVEGAELLDERCIAKVIEDDSHRIDSLPLLLTPGNALRKKGFQKEYDMRCKHHTSRFINRFVLWMKRLLPKDVMTERPTDLGCSQLTAGVPLFGHGAVSDACTCELCKSIAVHSWLWSWSPEGVDPSRGYSVSPITAPKSWKQSRVICPMPTVNQTEGYCLKQDMDTHIRTVKIPSDWSREHFLGCSADVPLSNIILLDPDNTVEHNEDGSAIYSHPTHMHLWSVGSEYCTIDSTAASDCVLKAHIRLVGTPFAKALLDNAPKYFSYEVAYGRKGKTLHKQIKQPMNMFAPMGAVTTFPVERVVFAAITFMAYEYHHLFTGEKLRPFFIFGDDIACDVRVYDLVMELLELFGFLPNRDKSFGPDSNYRESCGRHFALDPSGFHDGEEVTAMYFPRHPMNDDYTQYDSFKNKWDSRASSLLALNNRLFTDRVEHRMRFGLTYLFINRYIHQIYPDAINTHPNMPWYEEGMLIGTEVVYPIKYLPSAGHNANEAVVKDKLPLPTVLDMLSSNPSIRIQATCVGKRATRDVVRKGRALLRKPCRHTVVPSLDAYATELLYQEYLASGPQFDNELDRVLGVTTRRNASRKRSIPSLDFQTKWF